MSVVRLLVADRDVPRMIRGCARLPASHRWLIDVVDRYGSELDNEMFQLPCSQAALARDAGCSPGTIQARIRVLERQGLVVSRRPLTVRLTLGASPQPRPTGGMAGAGNSGQADELPRPKTPAPSTSDALPHLLAANASLASALLVHCTPELIHAQREVLDAIGQAAPHTETAVADPRNTPADPRTRAADPRLSPADPRLSEGESVSENLSEGRETDSLPASRKRGSANSLPGDLADPRRPYPRIREDAATAEEIDELIKPLVLLADRCGLVGVNDRSGIHEALGQHSPTAIRHAVSQVSRMTKAGRIRSPVGWLVTAARRGDPDLFAVSEAATPPPPLSQQPEADPETDAAKQAVAAATADQLAVLDQWIRVSPGHARICHLIFDPNRPQMLHTARLEAWRALQEVP